MVGSDMPGDLVELLFVRSVWALDGALDAPPAVPTPAAGTSRRPARDGLEGDWADAWHRSVGREPVGYVGWVPEHGTAGLDVDALRSWLNARRRAYFALSTMPLTAQPLWALRTRIEHSGIDRVLVLPVSRGWARRLGATVLMAWDDYADAQRFEAHLDALAP